ncbi:MAG TPA: response regulator [Aggregatilineales bacterium]|nr:response regulator [Aggregatilineales bacterium]
MTTRVLIVDPDIAFAVPVKRALEQAGNYSVSVFANGKAALELVQRQPQDVVVLDFHIADMPLTTLIAALRAIQPGLFILTSPRTESEVALLPSLDTQGSITKPYYARQLEPVVRQAVAAKGSLAKQISKEAKAAQKKGELLPAEPPVEPDDTFRRLVSTMHSGDVTQKNQPVTPDDSAPHSEKRDQLQAVEKLVHHLEASLPDEPEVPEGATIRDLVSGQAAPPSIEEPKQASSPPVEILDILLSEPDAPGGETTAREEAAALALDAVSDDTVPLESLVLPEFVARVEQEIGDRLPAPLPMPAWAQDFELTQLEPSSAMSRPSSHADQNEGVRDTKPPPLGAKEPPVEIQDTPIFEKSQLLSPFPGETQPMGGVVQEELERDQRDTDFEGKAEPEVFEPAIAEFASIAASQADTLTEGIAEGKQTPPPTAFADSPDTASAEGSAATLAVQLTQWTVNSAAAATLVTRGSALIAAAGQLSTQDVAGAVAVISTAWQEEPEKGASLVRFIHVPEAGDYLLYSIASTQGMILSMLFPSDTPLKTIRKQARDLLNALERVPEPPGSAEPQAAITLPSRPTGLRPPDGLRQAAAESSASAQTEPPRAEGPQTAYAFVWLPREGSLPPDITEMLVEWIAAVTRAHAWELDGTDIQPTYVSAQISIPANETPTATIESLLRETAERSGQGALWADAYYIVAPGRAVTQQEIAQFVEYMNTAA